MKQRSVRIVGAGVSGLTAAVVLARRGVDVEIFERQPGCGVSHPVRWDAVENWSTQADLNVFLAHWSLENSPFRPATTIEVRAFDGESHTLTQHRPLLYVTRRGDQPDSLDAVLKRQALDLGVRIRYGATLARE